MTNKYLKKFLLLPALIIAQGSAAMDPEIIYEEIAPLNEDNLEVAATLEKNTRNGTRVTLRQRQR